MPNPHNPAAGIDLRQHNRRYREDLSQRICLAQYAGGEISRACRSVQQSRNDDDANVSTEDHDSDPHRDQSHMHQYKEERAQQQFVRNGVEIGAKLRALAEDSGWGAVQTIADAGKNH